MSKNKSYTDRFKKMKESIEKNKDILKDKFPDDITVIGNPDLIRKDESEIEEDDEDSSDEK